MKIRDLIVFGLIIAGIIFFFQWRLGRMEEKMMNMQNSVNGKIDNSFRILSDSVSAKSQITVLAQPGLFDKIFNTALNKQYKDIQEMIPKAVKGEIEKLKIENKTTTITKTEFIIKGDSVIYLNSEGVVKKIAKIIPLNKDSSLLIIVPQDIELTTVQVNPDKDDPSKLSLFVTAFNKTTGDTIRIKNSITYVIPEKNKWKFNYKPYIGLDYDLLDGGLAPKAGLNIITYNGKKVIINMAGIEIKQNLKNQKSGIDIKLIQLQLK